MTNVSSLLFQTEMSQLLQTLSEKAKSGTEFIQKLKVQEGRVQVSALRFEMWREVRECLSRVQQTNVEGWVIDAWCCILSPAAFSQTSQNTERTFLLRGGCSISRGDSNVNLLRTKSFALRLSLGPPKFMSTSGCFGTSTVKSRV